MRSHFDFRKFRRLRRWKWSGVRERLGQPAGTPVCVCLWQMAVLDYSRCFGSFRRKCQLFKPFLKHRLHWSQGVGSVGYGVVLLLGLCSMDPLGVAHRWGSSSGSRPDALFTGLRSEVMTLSSHMRTELDGFAYANSSTGCLLRGHSHPCWCGTMATLWLCCTPNL